MERPGREGPGQADIWGRASDNAHVYQAKGSQYISHVHLHGTTGAPDGTAPTRPVERGAALEWTQERVTLLIRTLSLTEAEWQARCAELEEKARRARAEGRAEALAEAQEQLQTAELRVMKAQRMMREAVREREKAEALLTQAQQELALRRRAEERREEEAARRIEAAREATSVPAARLEEEGEQFAELLERAEAELGAVRDDLRLLGEGMPGQNAGEPAKVIQGQSVRRAETDGESAGGRAATEPHPTAGQTPRRARESRSEGLTGSRRPLRIGAAWLLFALPPWVPMLVVTSNRAAYASDAAVWQEALFTVVSVLGGCLAYALLAAVALGVSVTSLSRRSESSAFDAGAFGGVVGSLLLLLAGFFTPLTWIGPAGEWGQSIGSVVGLG